MEIFKEFGIQPALLVAQVVNFLILLFLMKKFLYKPLLKTIKKREDEIKKGLEGAEMGHQALLDAQAEEHKILTRASDQASKMIDMARSEANDMKKDLEEKAKLQAEKVLADAKNEIDRQTREAEATLTENISRVAVSILERTVPQFLTEKEQKEAIKKAVDKIKKYE